MFLALPIASILMIQYGEVIWPPYESTHKPPKTTTELQKEMERLRLERQTRRGETLPTISFPNATQTEQPLSSVPRQEPPTERLV
jgi:hypothetical protein